MEKEKDPRDKDTEVQSESSDINAPRGSSSPFSLPKLMFGMLNSSLKGALRGTLDQLDTIIPKVSCGTDKICGAEPGTIEIYDREAILYELAHPDQVGDITKIKRMHGSSATEILTDPSKNCETEDAERAAEEYRKLLTEQLRETLQAVPDSLLHLFTGRIRPGDCGRPLDQKPDWLDMEKLQRGQKFARDHIFSVFVSEMLSFFVVFSFTDSLKPLIMTQKSSTPYTAFKRYLSTVLRIKNWYTTDPWTKGTAAWKDILTVRAMHATARRKLKSFTNEEIDAASTIADPWCSTQEILLKDFSEACEAPVVGQCPYMAELNSPDRPKGINQAEMALTQWSFMGLIISFPEQFGVHDATDEDLEAFCHLWRSIGYQLGIEDEFNYCRGTLEEMRQRNNDFIETWVKPNLREITPDWEHMLRCIFTGMSVVLPGMSYEAALLYLTEILGLRMPRLYASLSYKDWMTYNFFKCLMNYTLKLPGVSGLVNTVLNRALDRAEKFTPEELEAIQIKLSEYYRGKKENRNV